jgi:hypothetical protein
MAHPLILPAVGASLILALAGGIKLGESTVSMINPIHFQGPAIHPRDRGAAIDERQLRDAEPSFASLYGWDQGRHARAEDCGGCEAVAARDAYARLYEPEVTVHRAMVERWDDPSPIVGAETDGAESEIETRDFDAELEQRVARYAYYDIETPAAVGETESDSE